MLKRYWVKSVDQKIVESIDSDYDPEFKYHNGNLVISIIGRDCEMLYYADAFYIVEVEDL